VTYFTTGKIPVMGTLQYDYQASQISLRIPDFCFSPGSLENAFESLRDLAVENGAIPGIELIQMREKDKIILFGLPGTLQKIKEGNFPPPPLPPRDGSRPHP
jgi:hypothetical protein